MLNNNKKINFIDYTTRQTYRRNNEPGGGTSVSIDTKIINSTNNFEIESINFKTKHLEATSIVIKHKKIKTSFICFYLS